MNLLMRFIRTGLPAPPGIDEMLSEAKRKVRVLEVLHRCRCPRFMFDCRPIDGGDGAVLLWVDSLRRDADTGEEAFQKGRKFYVSRHATDSEIVQTAWLAVQTFEIHELRESFLYRGKAIFGPHHDVDSLREFCDDVEPDARWEPTEVAELRTTLEGPEA